MMFWLAIVLSYLLGAIPFGFIIARTWKGVDVRRHGSGNIGFTNVLRVAGAAPGVLTLVLDIGKGYVAAAYLAKLEPDIWYLGLICGLAAIIGHNWPIYLLFRGGKGIAATIGVFLYVDPLITLIGLGIWILAVGTTRYVSLGSILFVCSIPVLLALFAGVVGWTRQDSYEVIAAAIVAVMGVLRHTGNIKRLLNRTERKIGEKVET